jgi:Saxitoxin biosynthesis operon protein SxtJ
LNRRAFYQGSAGLATAGAEVDSGAGFSLKLAARGHAMATNEPVVAHRKVIMGSNKSFGLVFAAFFAIVALLPLIHSGPLRWWALAVAVAFAAAAFVAPRLLQPLNWLWFKLGLLLHHVVNPVIMAAMFYGAMLPMGLLLRFLGKDLLRLKREPGANSYWIAREPPAPSHGSMSKQF